MSNAQDTYPHPVQQIIETCLYYANLARFDEATACLLHAREQLHASHSSLAAVAEAYIASHTRYRETQQTLQSACRSFALAEAELHSWLARLARTQPTPAEPPSAPAPAPFLLPSLPSEATAHLPPLTIHCFGRFAVERAGKTMALCANRNGRALLRYLAAQPHHSAPLYVLMELLWPEDAPEIARHKLHVAASALRRSLNAGLTLNKGVGYLLCDGTIYQLNPSAPLQIDIETFVNAYRAGYCASGTARLAHYEAACQLYTGPFLLEDLYADWTQIRREQLVQIYLEMCASLANSSLAKGRYDAAISWAGRVLAENRCDEAAYRQLMLAYAGAGRRAEALRQFQRCRNALVEEMGIGPSAETLALFEQLHNGDLPDFARAVGD